MTAPISTTTAATPTTTLDPADAAAYVLAPPPDGLQAVLAQERTDGHRSVGYAPGECGERDIDLNIEIRPESKLTDVGLPDHEMASGPTASIYELWDDGRRYGYGGAWSRGDGTMVDVTMRNSDATIEDLYAVLDSVTPIEDAEWIRLNRVIGEDQRAIREGETPTTALVVAGELGGEPLTIEFLIPQDFPLGDDDCRSACYSVSTGDSVAELECRARTIRHEVGNHRLLAGRVPGDLASVSIEPYPYMELADPTPPSVSLVEIPGMDDRLFVAEVPLDFCAWNVDRGLEFGAEQGGLTPSDPDRIHCTFFDASTRDAFEEGQAVTPTVTVGK
ncbi:MAG: hypothetical protein ACI9C1_002088 [Candidatus Aldehydirespiratoraceae bacterium]|jgi:hypothetical protein